MAAIVLIAAMVIVYIGFSIIQESINPHSTTSEEERYASFKFGCGMVVLGIIFVFSAMSILFTVSITSEEILYRSTF